MDVQQLIALATEKAGTLGAVAEKIGKHQNRLTRFKNGISNPDPGEIGAMALIAELPVLETIAEIEDQIRPELAGVWKVAMKERGKR
jgi:hypothetical protein